MGDHAENIMMSFIDNYPYSTLIEVVIFEKETHRATTFSILFCIWFSVEVRSGTRVKGGKA